MEATATVAIYSLLGLNCLTAVILFVIAFLRTGGQRHTLLLYGWFTLVCPVAGPLFYLSSKLIGIVFHNRRIDMASISFSQIRDESVLPPDSQTEMNYVPLEDAIAFTDAPELRRLLINILKSGDRKLLGSISRAISNPDTEVSHYAATAVLDTLSDFRTSLQEYTQRLETNPDDAKTNLFILEYTYQVLHMHVMDKAEQTSTIYAENALMETLYTHNLWYMQSEFYLWMTDLLISIEDYSAAETWVNRGMQHASEQLSTYKARLHLYYAKGDSMSFFSCMKELEHSDLPVDKETLDLIRAYNAGNNAFAQKAGDAP